MNIQKIFLYLLIPASLYFCSCQKEISSEAGITATPNNILSDSNYLSKIYDLFPSGIGTGMDTVSIITLHYDSNKRVISMNDSNMTATGPAWQQSYTYSYSGNDSLPYLSVEIDNVGLSTNDTSIDYHFYDAAGRNLEDSILVSVVPNSGKQIVKYSYNAGHVYGQNYKDFSGTPFLQRDTAIIDSKGDIVSNNMYDLTGGVYTIQGTAAYSYDTHLSPFSRLSNFKAHQQFPNGETLLFEHMPFNNILSQQEFHLWNGSTFTETASYLYNTSGYPVRENSVIAGNPEVLLYNYKSL